jgi:hypothetical protein
MFSGIAYPQGRKGAEISQLIVNKIPIMIISSYKGVILHQPVHVLNAIAGRVTIQAPDLAVCFTLKEKIQFYCRKFQAMGSAWLLATDTIMGKLELTDLDFTNWHWYERQSDRVQPRDPICLHGEYKKTPIRASLDNLSPGGISIMIYKYNEMVVRFDPDSILRLTLQLPGEDTPLDLKGKVVHERQTGRLGIIGLHLLSTSAQDKHIQRYVRARKAEILAELEQASREFLLQQSMPILFS